jgi:hypothetical protein
MADKAKYRLAVASQILYSKCSNEGGAARDSAASEFEKDEDEE